MAYPHLTIDTERVLLEKFFIGATGRIPHRVLSELTRNHADHILRQGLMWADLSATTDEMLIYMKTFVLKGIEDGKETLSVTYPQTWWDHFKDSWLKSGVPWKMQLAHKLEPPKYITEKREVKLIRVCPHNDTYISENDLHFKYLLWRNYDEIKAHVEKPQ